MFKNFLLFLIIVFVSCGNTSTDTKSTSNSTEDKTHQKAKEAKTFVAAKNMSTDIAVLIDMGIHSGLERFFIYDLKNEQIVEKAMVSHGCCDQPWGEDYSKENPIFSNVPDSHCSSLGKFKIGKRGWSNWGIHVKYLMHGLEASNSNALDRIIVLHSWEMVSDEEIYPNGTPEGWGCPAVSNSFMRTLDMYLQSANQPVLMWIYE